MMQFMSIKKLYLIYKYYYNNDILILTKKNRNQRSKATKALLGVLVLLSISCLALYFLYINKTSDSNPGSQSKKFHRDAVVSNGPECAPIGM